MNEVGKSSLVEEQAEKGLFACLMLWLLCPRGVLLFIKLILPDYCQDEEEFKAKTTLFITPFLYIIPAIIEHAVLL